MESFYDEFSKSLAASVPRRQSLRLLGAALAGAIFSPLGLNTAWSAGRDPCKDFCHCSTKKQQNACLAACRACNSNPTLLCGACGSYACTDFANDFYNCRACGNACDKTGPYEVGSCVNGACVYDCVEGTVECDGTCTPVLSDPRNCGACGNVCPESAPYCNQGECSACAPGLVLCGGLCVNLAGDPGNCGACGNICPQSAPHCDQGVCVANDCVYPLVSCGGVCVNILSDSSNCGACGNVCPPGFFCSSGVCWDPICQFVEC
jgi:hypothetical protein